MNESGERFIKESEAKQMLRSVFWLVYHTEPGEAFENGYTWKDHAEMSDGCLMMIAETLEAIGCCHGHDSHKSTPPMMYNDWIRCAIAKREKRIRELEWKLWHLAVSR